MIFYTTEKSLSDTKSKLVELFDLEIRNVKNTEPSSWLKSSINYEWPKITKILYHTIDDVYTFLQDTKAGKDLLKKHEEKKVYKIIFAQTDNYNVDLYEQHIYELLKSLYLSKYNIEIYDTGFLSDDYENINYGITVLSWMEEFFHIKCETKPNRHFLTLNSRQKEARINLFDFLEKNNLLTKGICSFHWMRISPDISLDKFEGEIDDKESHLEKVHNGILHSNSVTPLYEKTLFEIVSPSAHNLVTEKTLKPLLHGKPFLLWIYFILENDWSLYPALGHSNVTRTMSMVLFWRKWYKSIGIDIDYFNIDYYNPNSIREKIIELCSMSLDEIQEKYKDTFEKAEQNKILINKFIEKRYGQFGIKI